ncbi:MAG TPA: hypothetical protein VID04_02545 [Methylomirabilota bacterium]|jgi:hypothetical protein
MIGSFVALAVIALVVLAPLVWSVVRDRRAERALGLQAEIQHAIDRRLGGASYVAVHTEAPSLWHGGRVVLDAPRMAESLVDEVAPTALGLTPDGYELVIALGPGSAEAPADGVPLKRAA